MANKERTNMADNSITRMNLSAIKKVDPYAKNIVDSSSHVAFYTFNSDLNEWEKTDVEGAFFIYNRNAEPYHSIFINNRLNTTSFVEPITKELELQSQPPFLLYRNERSRIRGFWFYNSDECDRISNLVNSIVHKKEYGAMNTKYLNCQTTQKTPNTNIFNMLSKAQQEYNAQITIESNQKATPCNVLEFFASAKQRTSEIPRDRILPLSVNQLEKEQRTMTPNGISNNMANTDNRLSPNLKQESFNTRDEMTSFTRISESIHPISGNHGLLVGENDHVDTNPKPTLIPPTMFDKPILKPKFSQVEQIQPLDTAQFVQALSFLIQNDDNFVKKLHEAYIKSFLNLNSNYTYQ